MNTNKFYMQELEEILENHEIPDENPSETQDGYIRRKRREFLDEMVAHFSTNPRAKHSSGKCSYSHNLNGGCAIGRKLSAEKAELMEDDYICGENYEKLPISLYLMGEDFLSEVQSLHDDAFNGYWLESGLSEMGKNKVEWIKGSFISN